MVAAALQSLRAKALLLPLLLPLRLRPWRDDGPLPWHPGPGPWTSASRKERPGLNSDRAVGASSEPSLALPKPTEPNLRPAQPNPKQLTKSRSLRLHCFPGALPHLLVYCPQRPSFRPADVRLLRPAALIGLLSAKAIWQAIVQVMRKPGRFFVCGKSSRYVASAACGWLDLGNELHAVASS